MTTPAPRPALPTPRVLVCGDAALSVEFGERIDPEASARVLALDAALRRDPFEGLVETMPSFRALLVRYEPLTLSFDAAVAAVRARLAAPEEVIAEARREATGKGPGEGAAAAPSHGAARLWRFPVAYGGEAGPDLPEIARRVGLSEAAVVAAHSGALHRVYMLGFLPGAPFLGGLPAEIDLPRRAEPRVTVPARTLALAVGLSVIYPVESPGGWNLLGRTPVRLFAPEADPPALLAPGDAIRFEPASAEAVARLAERAAAGDWRPEAAPLAGGA